MKRILASSLLVLAGIAVVGVPAARGSDEKPGLMDPTTQAPGLKVGEKAPSVTLRDVEGRDVDLGALYGAGPVVVTFYRGGWCPFCTKALKDWEGKIDELRAAGGTFVAISPETPQHASKTMTEHSPSLVVLSDMEGAAGKAFRVAFEMPEDLQKTYKGYGVDLTDRNASGKWELPAPATFVIGKDGVVRWAFADWDYKKRANPDEVIEAVQSLGSAH
ncbi:MAG: peroxiredoxin-like family protein [Phycisphaerales bacterium]